MMEPLREVRDGYIIPILLGTPPQVIQVYMDTGSDLTWVPCGNLSFECMDCDDYRNSKILSTIFSPTRSPSSVRDLCGSSFCIDIHNSDNFLDPCTMAGCSLTTLLKSTCPRPCPSFAYTYGAGGVVTGTLTRDTLRVHESYSPNITKEIPNFCFGCVGSSHREPIGIAGFGRGLLSLPSQLGFLQNGFSHCFLPFKFANNPNMSSLLIVGDLAISSQDEKHLQFTPMLKSLMYPNFYYVGLEAIKVGDSSVTEIPLSLREFDSNGNGGMLIDSGTTYTHLPEPFYSQLLSLLKSVISYPRAKEMESRTGFDLCHNVPYTNSSTNTADSQLLPTISFHFLNNVSIVLSEGSHFYAMAPPHNSTVVKCLLFQSMEDGDYGPAGVLGSFQQQNVKVVYDLGKERIGFQQMDCASAAASA
ncbi:probable aspartyl protease At4g16563 [Ziziphus jujuba]|uniref:Probable aspartyl protease At4g16563 n=1 Tax=Ziziphus jujuba TaxID=326968 RepID=A0A6P4A3D4_ZIZJJ|nr:probable aspartyl protease At4g16563 [Ziziphus jujuba]